MKYISSDLCAVQLKCTVPSVQRAQCRVSILISPLELTIKGWISWEGICQPQLTHFYLSSKATQQCSFGPGNLPKRTNMEYQKKLSIFILCYHFVRFQSISLPALIYIGAEKVQNSIPCSLFKSSHPKCICIESVFLP